MMGSRPRSPSPYPAPWWAPQPAGPGPAKRRRLGEPEGPEPEAASILEEPAGPGAEGALTSVVVLAAGCALQVPLGDADLVLEPAPAAVLQVSLGDHTLFLVPEAVLGSVDEPSGGEGGLAMGGEPGSFPGAPEQDVGVEQGFFCASADETDEEDEDSEEDVESEVDVDSEDLAPWVDSPAGSDSGFRRPARRVLSRCSQGPIPEASPWVPTPSLERCSPRPYFNRDVHLLRPFPNSPLQPLPPSPSPGPQERPQRPPRPPCKARRRLFQE